MWLFDPNFKKNPRVYMKQCLLAMVVIFAILYLIDTISNMTVIASLGASAFIALTMPNTHSSHPRFLIGGYVIGAICGILMNFFNDYLTLTVVQILGHSPHVVTCALSVGLAMFLMTALNFRHPPAAALAMGLVLEQRVMLIAFIAVLGVVILSLLKQIAKKWLQDLT